MSFVDSKVDKSVENISGKFKCSAASFDQSAIFLTSRFPFTVTPGSLKWEVSITIKG